jgi:hypothetical protein
MLRITIIAAAVLAIAACSSSAGLAPAPTPIATTPTATYDEATLTACRHAAQAARLKDPDDETYMEDARAARAAAGASDVDALREAATKSEGVQPNTPADEAAALAAAYDIDTWCLYHRVNKP